MQELKSKKIYSKDADREKRLNELEREYDSKRDPANDLRLEELNFYLSGLLGRNNLHYLREYADLLIARYNTDAGWFYNKGYEDARRLMSH